MTKNTTFSPKIHLYYASFNKTGQIGNEFLKTASSGQQNVKNFDGPQLNTKQEMPVHIRSQPTQPLVCSAYAESLSHSITGR